MAGAFEETQVDYLARLFKLLGDPNRLRILFTIGGEERSVSEIIEATALPQTLASFHLRVLREAGVVVASRRGAFVYYRLTHSELLERLRGLEPYTGRVARRPGGPEPPFSCLPCSSSRRIW